MSPAAVPTPSAGSGSSNVRLKASADRYVGCGLSAEIRARSTRDGTTYTSSPAEISTAIVAPG
jgi:hypothetical protein